MTLPEFSVRQRVLVNVLFFVCFLGGLAAFSRIPVEFYPDVALNGAVVTTIWSGASAEEVERLVTQRIEEEIGQVTDIQEIRSTSQANTSSIRVDFDEDLDDIGYEAALNDLRAALDRVQDLPEDADEPYLFEIIARAPALGVAVVDTAGVGPTALREVARDVARRLKDIPGVEDVQSRGDQDREIRVFVDRDAAARYGLAVADVAARIRRHNLNLPAGTYVSEGREATVRAHGDYAGIEEILATVVHENRNGSLVRLGEIATLEEGLEKRRFESRYNGQPAQLLTVNKKDDEDAVAVVARVDAWLEGYRALLPPGVELRKTLDTAEFIQPRMQTLIDNLLSGIVLVVAILWFTIGFRNAALTSIAIPFSFLTAMIFFPILDISINSTTLMGMLLVSGMLVDDAIIVLENIYRRIEAGQELRRAVVEGAQEVMWPVIVAVTTTCAAFAPLLLVGGVSGRFMEIFPKCVIVCLLASLFECLLILPAHYLDFGSRKHVGADPARSPRSRFGRVAAAIRGASDRGIEGARAAYERALAPVLEHRFAFAMLFFGFGAFALGYSRHLDVDLFPGEFDTFNVLLEAQPDYGLDQTEALVHAMEEPLLGYVGGSVRDLSTVIGVSVDSNYERLTGPNLSQSFLVMRGSGEAAAKPERILLEVKDAMKAWREANPEGIVELRVAAQQSGPPVGSPVEVRIASNDYALAKAVANEMKPFLRGLPGVFNVEDNLKLGPVEVRLQVDDQRAARHGLSFEEIAAALRAANDGIVASGFRSPAIDEDIDIRVMLAARYRRSLADLLDVELMTSQGYLVKLRDVAEVELTRGYLSYRRFDERRTVVVYADVDDDLATSSSANAALRAAFADVESRHPGVDVKFAGEFEATGDAFVNLGRVFPVALVGIYMLLAALFRSYLQPLVVVAAIPFGFIGVILGVGLLDYNVSYILMYAAIGLTGVVVNDSLVMVDFINRARAEGMPLREAVRRSGARRFRPILLTTLTTVMALLPMALGLQGASKTYGPFAAAVAFGLIVAMVGTLFAVPLAYTSLIEWQERLDRAWRRWRGAPELEAASLGAGGGA